MTPPPTDELLAELPWLRRFAAGLVRSAADADDLVQDTLGEALTTRSGDRPLRGLLGGIARNLARGRHRDTRTRGEREARHARDGSDVPAPGADAEAERLELLRELLAELRALPPAQRRAITARYFDGLEPAEIARRDGVRAATVRSQLARGLSALRERLDTSQGGRQRWLSSLAPWALGPAAPGAFDAPSTASPDPISSAASGSPPASSIAAAAPEAAPALPALALGLLVMKLAALLVVPAVLGVFLWNRIDGDADSSGRADVARAAAADLDATAPTGGPTERLPAETDAQAPDRTPVTETLAAPPIFTPTSVHLVDMLTGEPVPFMRAELTWIAGVDGARVRSDASGSFVLNSFKDVPHDTIRVIENDRAVYGQRGVRRQTVVPYPITEPIPVHVGPTFHFELPPELEADRSRLSIRLRNRDDASPYNDRRSTLRDGPTPWARLDPSATDLGDGPFDLVLEDVRGMRTARLTVDRCRGITHETLRPTFEPCGNAELVLLSERGAPGVRVVLEPLGHDVPNDVELHALPGRAEKNGSAVATLRLLPPGAYTWRTVGAAQNAEGELEIVAGETTRVELAPEALGLTFDSDVTIDASAAPEADPTRWLVMVTSMDQEGAGFMARAERDEAGGPGRFRIPLRALAPGTWHVALQVPAGFTLEPGAVEVTPGAPPETIVVTAGSARRRLELEVVDEEGHALPATAAVLIVPREAFEFRREHEGALTLLSEELPGDEPVDVFVRAPGHRGVLLRHDARTDPAERRVVLERGWSTRVMTLDVQTLEPVLDCDVLVDGEPAGRPGPDGWCWVEREEAPLRIDVRPGDDSLEIESPFDHPGRSEDDLDPPYGLLFQATRGR